MTVLLVAASLRPESFVEALLSSYVILLAEVTALTGGLSLVREVTRTGLALGVAFFLVLSAAIWQRRGRPGLPVGHLPGVVRRALWDPIVLAFVLVVSLALAYELVLVVAMPANNWDSLTYHLARVALWAQHGGIYWVQNAPTDRINVAQPVAEQQILYLFFAVGRGALYALPQFAAQLAIVASTYLTARRLGYELRSSACAALVFCTFSLVALEATTAQNDLVAASLPAIAAAFLLGRSRQELMLAGLAVALGLGVKATTALVLPVLVLLALRRGRRAAALFSASAIACFAAFSLWSFVVNLARTGHLLGKGPAELTHATPTIPGALAMATAIFYRLADLTGFHDELIWVLLAVGLNASIAVAFVTWLKRRPLSLARIAAIGVPFAAPALTLGFAALVRAFTGLVQLPVNQGVAFLGQDFLFAPSAGFSWGINRVSQEDIAGFGPIGGLMLIAVSAGALLTVAVRRADARYAALGLALPLFLLGLGASSASYNPFLARFVIVPAALTVPLAAALFRHALAGAAVLVVSALTVGLVLVHDAQKPLNSAYGHPWQLAQGDAARLTFEPSAGDAVFGLDAEVPSYTPVGAVLGSDEPSYLLFGASHSRPVEFLPRQPREAVGAALRAHVSFVVIGGVSGVAGAFSAHGWVLKDLVDPYWQLAIDCSVPSVRRQPYYHCPSA